MRNIPTIKIWVNAFIPWPEGRQVAIRRANTSSCSWLIGGVIADPIGGIAFAPSASESGISFRCSISNPHLPSGSIARAGAVDVDLSFAFNIEARRLSVNGVVDDFPAFEIYAAFNNGTPATLLQAFPRPGMGPFNLLGPPLNVVRGEVRW